MSPDKNTQIAALKGILDIVINDLHSFESLFVNNVIDDLNRIIANGEGEEVFALSTTILHVLGVRCQVMDAAVCAREATESLIQIIHSENKQQSKAGSKALCDLVEANYVIQNSLLTTGFAQVVLRTLILGTQEQGKDSSSSQQSSSDKLIPTFIKAGLLNVILKLTEQSQELESLADEKTEYEMEISQLREQGIYPIEIINKDPQHIEITALDLVQRRINIKKANPCTITLSQILESGIWSIEVLFQKTQGRSGIGVVRDLYNIPAGAIPTEEPHNKFIALFGGKRQEFSLYYRQVVIQGNAKFTDGQILRLEYDSESGRLFYFIDDVQQPVSFAGINKNQKLRFIIYMYYEESSCLIRSLKKIAVRTSNDNDADGKLVLWREL
ncbi:MAG: hypothetical protein EZS28_019421 [Streblomastix strix]|uniref:Uncharacterized protein n=1 Tax=Streblomastix strix TaxID=222440 RepID=A0A5J4VRW5_9EUKA|nr:MAG: hypothetical protein EZS28_019421 [Streblomastix strix]